MVSSEFDEQLFEHVLFIANQIEIENVERQRELLRSTVYSYCLQINKVNKFNELCKSLGLIEKKNAKLTEKQKEKLRKKGLEKAERIMKADKAGIYREKTF